MITGFLCFFCFVFFLCSGTVLGAERLNIVVSILPQKYFVEKIGGDKVQVSVMVEPGANPATYEPRPRQMGMLTSARIYFAIGVPFERVWLPRFENINPSLVIVPTQEGIKLFPISGNQKENGHAGAGGHGILDPHV
ncbi:MAG: cation ABC transporter substrate-binding protein, partial [Thermodesulfatator sp.]